MSPLGKGSHRKDNCGKGFLEKVELGKAFSETVINSPTNLMTINIVDIIT